MFADAIGIFAKANPATSGWLSCADYQRNSDVSWTTKRQALVELPGGNATIGSNITFPEAGTYMGVQFGFLLDEQCDHALRR